MTANTRELYEDAYRIARTSVYGLVIDTPAPDAIKNAYVSVGMREQSRFTGHSNVSLNRRLARRRFMRLMDEAKRRNAARKAARNDR